jgi:predicted nucleotidyltransferase
MKKNVAIKRETAKQKLVDLVDRVRLVRDDSRFLYRVTLLAVFGSYLTDKDRLGDIDIAFKLEAKEKDRDKATALAQEHTRKSGRQFRNMVEEIFWPENEVLLFLKSRSRSLSFHEYAEVEQMGCNRKIIYED